MLFCFGLLPFACLMELPSEKKRVNRKDKKRWTLEAHKGIGEYCIPTKVEGPT